MYKFTEAELFSLLAMNIFQYREGVRTKEALIETCRMLKDELGVAIGFCIVIKATLEGSFKENLEDMLFRCDDATNSTFQLLSSLYRGITSGELLEPDLLQHTEEALFGEAIRLYGDKESFFDMLHILTNKIEMLSAEK